MDGTASPTPTPTPTPANPNPLAPSGSAPARPDYIPEKFWDAKEGKPNVEGLAKSYAELDSMRGNMKEKLAAEIAAERLKARPEKPEGYKVAAPADAKDVVILDKPPGADFKPEAGKVYAVLKSDSALLKGAAALAYEYGVPQEKFSALVAEMAREIGFRPETPEETAAARKAVYAKLGEHGEARAQHVWNQLKGALGDKAAALDAVVGSAEAIEALEALLEKGGQKKFAPSAAAAPGMTEAEIRKKMDDPKYWRDRDPALHREVAEAFAKLYPGQAQTAPINPSGAR
jgi:hypothetical protein